jgi:malonyl-CoA O-methyltransferase
MAHVPFADAAFGLAWSNLALHWLDDPLPAIREAHRVLAVDGLFMFSTFGPDTLRELRASWDEAGGGQHVRRFIDLHDIGDALGQAGFAAPVMDMEVLTLTYDSLDGLVDDLRSTGSTNPMLGRPRGLTPPSRLARLRSSYERWRREGRLPATFEVIYGHAWKVRPRRATSGEAVISFAPRRK